MPDGWADAFVLSLWRAAGRDQEVIHVLMTLAHRKLKYGFGKLFETLRRRSHGWNHKRVYRLNWALRLNKWRKGKRQLPSGNLGPLAATRQINV